MIKVNKRINKIYKKINYIKQYNIDNAIDILKKNTKVKFIESVDVAIKLGINIKKSNQNIKGTVILPNGTGRLINIAVLTNEKNFEKAKLAGADYVGNTDLVDLILKKKYNFNIIIATPDSMSFLKKVGHILGPRGLMPNLKFGTITSNINKEIKNIKNGKIQYKNDKYGIIHSIIGKINFNSEKIKENLETLIISLKKNKPKNLKGIFFKKISLSTTMGIGLTINKKSLSILDY